MFKADKDLGLRVYDLVFEVLGLGLKFYGLGFEV